MYLRPQGSSFGLSAQMFIFVLMLLLCMTATALAASFPIVKMGSRGDIVKKVQIYLRDQGFLKGEADGICGKITVEAIKKFQKAKGLEVDGICGPATYKALIPDSEKEIENILQDKSSHSEAYIKGRPLKVHASAYSAMDPGNSKRTSTGTMLRKGVIAVDPKVIPLGTKVYIPDYGEAVAEDTGGGIRGNKIDIAFDTHEEALCFGRKNLEIYIIE